MSVEQYVVTGRYMKGVEVTGYHIVDTCNNDYKSNYKRVSREQFMFLLGSGAIKNCKGQFYKDDVIIRCSNGRLADLPVIDDKTGAVRKSESMTGVMPKKDMKQVLNQVKLIARIMHGRNNIGFVAVNRGGAEQRIDRQEVMRLAANKLVVNAEVQNNNINGVNKVILRGVGISLRDLPCIEV